MTHVRRMMMSVLGTAMVLLGVTLVNSGGGIGGIQPAQAQSSASLPDISASAWVERPHGKLRLISASTATGTAEILRLGLEFDLEPGWKVYWRSPGDAGYPPSITWDGSVNVAGSSLFWPVPERFSILGLQSVGYGDRAVLPLDVAVDVPGSPVILKAQVDYLVCSDICVPDLASLDLMLPPGTATPSDFAHDLGQWSSRVPSDMVSHGLVVQSAHVDPQSGVIEVVVTADLPLQAPDLFIETPPGVAYSPPHVTVSDAGRQAVLQVMPAETARLPDDLTTLAALVTDGSERGAEIPTGTLSPATVTVDAASSALPTSSPQGLLLILGLAVIGGFLLNLMPCVLPVLSIKVLSLVGQGGAAPRQVRKAFLASAAGIVFSFLVLAAAVIAVKLSGTAVGWGLQFQQPVFLAALSAILVLFAANLWGWFEIPLPGFANHVAQSDGTPAQEESLGSHFTTGAFATLLATPCSAPFLGTAVGFALAAGPEEIVSVFLALGVGMALPYVGLALAPKWAAHLPKPGSWMVTLKRVLSVALLATALWLLSVLAVQTSVEGAVLLGLALLLPPALFAARALMVRRPYAQKRRSDGPDRRAPVVAALGIVCLPLVIALPVMPGFPVTEPGGSAGSGVLRLASLDGAAAALAEDQWVAFDADLLAQTVAEGKTVFVDVTADWCITCKVNKVAVLDSAPIMDAFQTEGVVTMRADWTRPNPAISAYLSQFGRYGIPFNAVYGPGHPTGLPLPELLTQAAVLDGLAEAGATDLVSSQTDP